MTKIAWKPGTMLYPIPPVMVTCGTMEEPNVLTIAWTGIINSDPAMTYISVRPSRHSYEIIKKTGEFVINLTTEKMLFATDYCGVKSGATENKIEATGLTLLPCEHVKTPLIEQSPLSLECRVTEIKPLGSHDMFLAEIVGVNVSSEYLDDKGQFALGKSGLVAFCHGAYVSLGEQLETFGFSVAKKKSRHQRIQDMKRDRKLKKEFRAQQENTKEEEEVLLIEEVSEEREFKKRPFARRDGERRDFNKKPFGRRDGERRDFNKKPYEKRDGERRDFNKKPYEKRDGERRDFNKKPFEKRDGERRDFNKKPYEKRDGERRDFNKKPFEKRDGERRDFNKKPYERRDGERRDFNKKPFERRDGERRDFNKKPFEKRDGERRDFNKKPFEKRDGERRDFNKKPFRKPEGGRRDFNKKPFNKK